MPEAAVRDVIVLDLHHELRGERLPLGGALGAPAAGAAGRAAGESRRAAQRLELGLEAPLFLAAHVGAEADVVEASVLVVEAEQQGADPAALGGVAESAHDAVRRAPALHLEHAVALARSVREIHALGYDPVQIPAAAGEPGSRRGEAPGGARESQPP